MDVEQDKFKEMTIVELIDILLNRYHTKLRFDIDRIQPLFEKVVKAHGQAHPNLIEAKKIFSRVGTHLLFHLDKEENILFPAMIHSVQTHEKINLSGPISCMETDHKNDEADLLELKKAMDNYEPFPNACNTYKTLLTLLKEISDDTAEHMYIENEVLFPQFLN